MARSRLSVILVGDSSVGKSSILQQLTDKSLDPYGTSTIGIDYFSPTISTETGEVPLKIWDTAGQECYRSLAKCYYRNADIAVVVFSLTDLNSFRAVRGWVERIREYAPVNIPIYIVGNKLDLVEKGACRCTTDENARTVFQEYGARYSEVSSIRHADIQKLFRHIATRLPKKIQGIRDPILLAPPKMKPSESTSDRFKNCCSIS